MRTLTTHMWKEWRDHRAVLLGIIAAIPALTVVGCWAFFDQIVRLSVAAPAFVGGASALTVLALSTELWAGESRRDTLAFARRLPRGLSTAFAAKTLFFLLAVATTAAYAALVLVAAGRAFGGPQVGADAWHAVTEDPLTWLSAAAAAVLGLWILLVSTWIPRGAAAAGAAALLLGLLALPGYLMHEAQPGYRPSESAILTVAWALAVLPVALTALCAISGLRFARGTWPAAWRGLVVVVALAGGGYAYGAHEVSRWVHLTPEDPEMFIVNGYVGPGARFAFVNAGRGPDVHSLLHGRSIRPWAIDLETGAWRELGDPGTSIGPAEGIGDCWATFAARGVGLLYSRPWKALREAVRYIDGATGEAWKTLPADVVTPDLRERIAAERQRLSPVRDPRGRSLWYSMESHSFERALEDGTIEHFAFEARTGGWPQAYPWGWHWHDGKREIALDASQDDPRAAVPWTLPEVPHGSWNRLSAERYLGWKDAPQKARPWFVADVRAGTAVLAKGLEPKDGIMTTLPGHVVVESTDVLVEPHVSRLFRVEPSSGERVEILLPAGVVGSIASAWVIHHGPSGPAVFAINLRSGERGLARLDDDATRLSGWTPAPRIAEVLATPDETSVLLIVDGRRIERARWGSPDREVLFPRANSR